MCRLVLGVCVDFRLVRCVRKREVEWERERKRERIRDRVNWQNSIKLNTILALSHSGAQWMITSPSLRVKCHRNQRIQCSFRPNEIHAESSSTNKIVCGNHKSEIQLNGERIGLQDIVCQSKIERRSQFSRGRGTEGVTDEKRYKTSDLENGQLATTRHLTLNKAKLCSGSISPSSRANRWRQTSWKFLGKHFKGDDVNLWRCKMLVVVLCDVCRLSSCDDGGDDKPTKRWKTVIKLQSNLI